MLDKWKTACYNTQALRMCKRYRGVEQLEARRAHNPEVVGSSPASATIKSPEIVRFRDFFLRFGDKKYKVKIRESAENPLTHILTHNRTSAYGFDITKQHLLTPKSEIHCNFLFKKPEG